MATTPRNLLLESSGNVSFDTIPPMASNDWDAHIKSMQERLRKLEGKREEAVGSLANAALGVRQAVLGQIDSEIAETKEAIDNFQWAKDHNR